MTKKWFLRLSQPLIIGTTFHGIDRDEVIDTLVVEYLPANSVCQSHEDVVSYWKGIDWNRSDAMLMEEFECCDLDGAVRRAQDDARRRAEAYCGYIARGRAAGHDFSHSGRMSHLRLVKREEGAD